MPTYWSRKQMVNSAAKWTKTKKTVLNALKKKKIVIKNKKISKGKKVAC